MIIAGKMMKRALALSIAIMVLFSFSAYADVVITDPAAHTIGDGTELITVTVTGATAGEEVALLIYDTEVKADNILYVDQKTASDSSVDFTFGIRAGFNKAATYTIKAGSTNSAAADDSTLVFEEIKVNGIKITSAPSKTVYANGETFSTEGIAVQEALDGVANGTAVTTYEVETPNMTEAGAKLVVVTSGEYTDTFAIFVQPAVETVTAVTGISDETSAVTVEVDGTVEVAPVVAPAEATDASINWVSLDPEVATVDNGVITGVAIGDTKVIGITVDGGFTVAYDVAVKYPTPTTGIVGRIVEATDTEKGIEGVSVIVYDENEEIVTTVLTDGNGDYAVELPEGFYLLAIEADGYAPRNDFSLYAETIEGEVTTIGLEGYLVLNESLLGDVDNTATVTVDDIFMVMGISNGETEYPTYLEYTDFE